MDRKLVGSKVDMMIRFMSDEYACAEASRNNNHDTKELVEGSFKCPKSMRDMFFHLASSNPDQLRNIRTFGFIFSGEFGSSSIVVSCTYWYDIRLENDNTGDGLSGRIYLSIATSWSTTLPWNRTSSSNTFDISDIDYWIYQAADEAYITSHAKWERICTHIFFTRTHLPTSTHLPCQRPQTQGICYHIPYHWFRLICIHAVVIHNHIPADPYPTCCCHPYLTCLSCCFHPYVPVFLSCFAIYTHLLFVSHHSHPYSYHVIILPYHATFCHIVAI